MKRSLYLIWTLSVAVVGPWSTSSADDRRIDKGKLTIMTFNAEFLFDGVRPDGQADFPWKESLDEAKNHMAAVAEVIKSANPDIVNLVEVENLATLEELNTTFLSGYNYRAYLVEGTDSYTRQNVGLLTRIDPVDGQVHRTEDKGVSGSVTKSVSKHYHTKIHVGDTDVTFIGIHLLAQPSNQARKLEREAQADAIRNLAVAQAASGGETVIWGDCNDYDGDCPDVAASTPISTVLSELKEMRTDVTSDDLVGVVCQKQLPQALRYTAWWDKNDDGAAQANEFTSIDHILISPWLAGKLQSVEIIHSYNPAEVSDHFPIVATFALSESQQPAGTLYISKVLPNPDGDERLKEAVWLTNPGTVAVSLSNWKLRDKSGHIWDLAQDGNVQASHTKQILRAGRPMSINNDGDLLELVDPSGQAVSVTSFGATGPEEILEFTQ